MKRYAFKTLLLSFLFVMTQVMISGQSLSAGGNIKAETVMSLPEWNDSIDDSRSGTGLNGTLYFDYEPSDSIRARAELGYKYQTGYVHPLGRYEASGLPSAVDQEIIPGMDFRQELYMPQIWAEYAKDDVFITIGKKPLEWGSCWFMNPTDRSGASSGIESLSDDTVEGFPGIRAEWLLTENAAVQVYAGFSDTGNTGTVTLEDGNFMNMPFGFKGTYYFDTVELSLGLAKEVFTNGTVPNRNFFALSDINFSVWELLINAELALRLPTNETGSDWNTDDWEADRAINAGVGTNYRFEDIRTDVLVEYYYLGSGNDPEEYDPAPILEGRGMLLGKQYMLLRGEKEFTNTVTASVTGLMNLLDQGGLCAAEIEWAPVMDSVLTITTLIPWGDADSEMGGELTLIPGLLEYRVWDSITFSCSYLLYF